MRSGIYAITTPTGERYIGSSVNVSRRLGQHRSALAQGTHTNRKLAAARAEHGLAALKFERVEHCAVADLETREQAWLDRIPQNRRLNLARVAINIATRRDEKRVAYEHDNRPVKIRATDLHDFERDIADCAEAYKGALPIAVDTYDILQNAFSSSRALLEDQLRVVHALRRAGLPACTVGGFIQLCATAVLLGRGTQWLGVRTRNYISDALVPMGAHVQHAKRELGMYR